MLEIQKYLLNGGTLESLKEDFAINSSIKDNLVILTYDQIDSPKQNPLVMEARGLTLELDSWNVVALPFLRFFNVGECPEIEKKFDWNDFSVEEKVDGSLIKCFIYNDEVRVNTRGSFANQEILHGIGKSWEDVFWEGMPLGKEKSQEIIKILPGSQDRTLLFELCSPYNKVVKQFDKPILYLLSGFHNHFRFESHEVSLDFLAEHLQINRPARYNFTNLNQISKWLDEQPEATFEGFVLKDRNGLRLKIKNKRYVALHHLKDNGNIFLPKRLIPLILAGEFDETVAYLGEILEKGLDIYEKIYGLKARLEKVWQLSKDINSQKEFALFVNKHTKLSGLLFEARKKNIDFEEVWKEKAEQYLIKHLG